MVTERPEEIHIDTKTLFFAAADVVRLTHREAWHLRRCDECRELKQLFRRLNSLAEAAASRAQKKSVNF